MRRRGVSFHESIDECSDLFDELGINFMTTTHLDEEYSEPLDFTKLCFNDEEEKETLNDELNEASEEEFFSRGRSRSHSVHQYDVGSEKYLYGQDKENTIIMQNCNIQKGNDRNLDCKDRTGPLQHREVLALKKVTF
jgi:hypothetical protein